MGYYLTEKIKKLNGSTKTVSQSKGTIKYRLYIEKISIYVSKKNDKKIQQVLRKLEFLYIVHERKLHSDNKVFVQNVYRRIVDRI